MAEPLTFKLGQADAGALDLEIKGILNEMHDPASQAAKDAQKAGVDPSRLADASVSVTEKPGFDPATTTILITIGTDLAKHVLEKFWDDVIWPRLKTRLGARAVGPKLTS